MSVHYLGFSNSPDAVASQLSAAAATATSTWAYNVDEFETKAKEEKDKIVFVLLGPDLSAEQVTKAKATVTAVFGKAKESKTEAGEGKWVLQIPADKKGEAAREWVTEQLTTGW